jgi:methylmalonyl-CoA mutase
MSENTSLTLNEFSPATYAQWREAAEASLKGAPFDKRLLTRTHEGITLRPIYNKEDLEALAWPEAWPGMPAYARGGSAAPRSPHVAQELPYGDVEEFNAALREDLMHGQNAIAIHLDVAGRRCLDPSEAETMDVGVCGLSLACLADAEKAFEGIEASAVELLLWAGGSSLPMLGMLEARGGAWRGAVMADPLTEYVRDGCLPLALSDAYDEMAAATRWSIAHGATLRTVGAHAGFWADAGASAVEELAFGLASAVESLRQLTRRDIPAADAAGQIVFTLSLNAQPLLQIAKVRALRLLWSRVQAAVGIDPLPARIHARGTVSNKTWLDPYTNMLRATVEAFAGVLAGVDSLHVSTFDEAARTPSPFARRIARNVHAILNEECEFDATADAAGGSWCIETLTAELASKAWELFQKVEAKGGMVEALRSGFPQECVTKVAAARAKATATRRDAAIGVNLFPNPEETPLPADAPDHHALHAKRAALIESLRPHAPPTIEVTVESIAAAFAKGATLGQIREALPRTGTPEAEIPRVRVFRTAEGYERLRTNASRHAKTTGEAPRAWLANFGPPKQYKARADFSAGFLAAGGFRIEQDLGSSSAEEAAHAAISSGCPVVVMCSTDDTYPGLVAPFVSAVRAKKPKTTILLAGYPEEHIDAFRNDGIDDFIHIRANCLEFLDALQHRLGIAH